MIDYSNSLIVACKIVSIPLSFVIIYFSYKFYKITSFSTLQAFAIGFSFILVADAFVLYNLFTKTEYQNEILWMKTILLSYGFSFIAASYYYKSKSGTSLHSINRIFSLAIIPVVLMIGVLSMLHVIDLLDYFTVEEYFRMYNLLILGYVVKHTLEYAVSSGRKQFLYLPIAFVILWLGQFTALIYSLDGGDTTFVLRVVLKTVGLAIFVAVIIQITRQKAKPKIQR